MCKLIVDIASFTVEHRNSAPQILLQFMYIVQGILSYSKRVMHEVWNSFLSLHVLVQNIIYILVKNVSTCINTENNTAIRKHK